MRMDIRWLILLLLYGFNVTNIHRFARCSNTSSETHQVNANAVTPKPRWLPESIRVDTNNLNDSLRKLVSVSPIRVNAPMEVRIKLLLLLHMIYRFPYKIGMLKEEISKLQQANAKEKGAKSKQTNIKNIQDQIERLSGKYDSSLKDFVTLLDNDVKTLNMVFTTYDNLEGLYDLYTRLQQSDEQKRKYMALWKLGWVLQNAKDKIPNDCKLSIFTKLDEHMVELKRFHLLERYKNNIGKILMDHSWQTLALNKLLDVMEGVDSADKLVELGYIDVLTKVARLTGIYAITIEELKPLLLKAGGLTKEDILKLIQQGFDKRLYDTINALTEKAKQVGVTLVVDVKSLPKPRVIFQTSVCNLRFFKPEELASTEQSN